MAPSKGGGWCAALNCSNSMKSHKNLSFFRFPKDNKRAQRWVHLSRRKDLMDKGADYLYKNCKLCSNHFEDVMFTSHLKNRLLEVAEPTIFDIPNPPPQITSKRKVPVDRHDLQPQKKLGTSSGVIWITSSASYESDTIALFENDPLQNCNTKANQTSESLFENDTVQNCNTQATQTSQSNLGAKLEQLQHKINILEIEKKRMQNVVTKHKTEPREISVSDFQESCEKFLPGNLSNFIKTQLFIKNNSKGNCYSENFKSFALNLYFLGPTAYQFLSTIISLPSKRCLQRITEQWQFAPGLQDFLFNAIKVKIEHFSLQDKLCSLCVDEMPLKSKLFYNRKSDEVVGLHDIGITKKSVPAKYVTVIMAKGIYGKWKQPLGYFFTGSTCTGNDLLTIVKSTIEKSYSVGLNVCVLTTNQGSNFIQLAKQLNVTAANPYFCVNNNKIFYIFDPPHLLKSVRNNLIKYNFKFDNQIATWLHITNFYKRDKSQNLRLAPKLTDRHIYPNSFQKMKVKYASQIFSATVSARLLTYVSFNALPDEAKGTAKFLELMDKLFDVFNSSQMRSSKIYNNAWMGSERQTSFFKRNEKVF